jgi:glutathione S-transferase
MQKVPCLVDGDFSIYESAAILCYLSSLSDSDSTYPKDTKKRAKVDQWLHWSHSNSTKGFTGSFLQYFLLPKVFKKEINETAQKEATENTINALKFLDSQLENQKYLTGSELTVADVLIGTVLDQMVYPLNYDLSPYKNVETWFNTLNGLDHWKDNKKGFEEFVNNFK